MSKFGSELQEELIVIFMAGLGLPGTKSVEEMNEDERETASLKLKLIDAQLKKAMDLIRASFLELIGEDEEQLCECHSMDCGNSYGPVVANNLRDELREKVKKL